MKRAEKTSTALHLFVGIGALAGGSAAIIDPVTPLGTNAAEMLRHSPFNSFLIPGLLLFIVIGLGNLFAALAFFKTWVLKPFISGFFASGLVIWIVVQCIMLRGVVALHVIYFFIGIIQGLLALYLLLRRQTSY